MSPLRLIIFAVLCCAASAALGQRTPRPADPGERISPRRPNVLFIMADDLGWGDLGCYGHSKVKTPNLDALAAQGALFTRYSTCSPVCSPARAAILTGRFPAEVGVHNAINSDPAKNAGFGQVDWLAPTPDLLARRLRDAGYVTGHFGKWHLGEAAGAPPLSEYGFDVHRSVYSGAGNPRYAVVPSWKWSSSEQIVDDAVGFLRAHQSDRFYLQVWLEHPHAPLDPTPDQAAAYSGLVTAPESDNGWTSARHCYMSAVTAMDGEIGRLLAEVDALGLAEETLVVFVSDNGPESQFNSNSDHSGAGHAGPFRGGKRSIYEGGVRVPCLVRWPDAVPAGAVSHASIAAVDWLPTFLALAGAPPAPGVSGENVRPALVGAPWQRSRPVMLEWRFGRPADEPRIAASPGGAIVLGDYKLLRNRDGSRLELYDLALDPMEVDNLARELPGIADLLADDLTAWQATLGPCVGCGNEGDNSYPWPR